MAKKKRDRVPNVPRSTGPEMSTTANKTTSAAKPQSGKAPSARMSQRDRKRRQSWIWLGAIGVVAVVLVVALVLLNNASTQASGAPPAASDLPTELISGSTKGNAAAPVEVVIFSDFECPACKNFVESIEKQLDESYIKTGKILYDYKHYPLPQHNPAAKYAANAAECAADQGRFWDMHAYLFQEGGTALPNNLTQGRLKSMAAALGLDTGKFNDCLSREQFGDIVNADINEARQLRVNSTPSVFVNDQMVDIGSLGYQGVITAIDAALAAAGQS
jgi:protein-disulfide isomerase